MSDCPVCATLPDDVEPPRLTPEGWDPAPTYVAIPPDVYACPACGARYRRRIGRELRVQQGAVWRCPKCRSTNAGPDESRSIADITYMQCRDCGNGEPCDSWQRDHEWTE